MAVIEITCGNTMEDAQIICMDHQKLRNGVPYILYSVLLSFLDNGVKKLKNVTFVGTSDYSAVVNFLSGYRVADFESKGTVKDCKLEMREDGTSVYADMYIFY